MLLIGEEDDQHRNRGLNVICYQTDDCSSTDEFVLKLLGGIVTCNCKQFKTKMLINVRSSNAKQITIKLYLFVPSKQLYSSNLSFNNKNKYKIITRCIIIDKYQAIIEPKKVKHCILKEKKDSFLLITK